MSQSVIELNKDTLAALPIAADATSPKYSIEFFHIYTDEQIGPEHNASIEYLREASTAWKVDHNLIVMIDNYNPTTHILSADMVFEHLQNNGVMPSFWAFEGDMPQNAKTLLESLPNNKLRRSYEKYIDKNGKYPCSLLTASWYLTRLGVFDTEPIRSTEQGRSYEAADRLINILPLGYKEVELRAKKIIAASPFANQAHNIQDLFYEADTLRKIELF